MAEEIKLLDIIDQRSLQLLQDSFAKATGMAALATDLNGPVTELSNPTEFCMNLTRKSKVGCERCNQCDLQGGEQALKTGHPAVYYCHGGLVDFASPIIVNGQHIGSLIGGQVLTEEPDFDKFRKIAKEIDIDPDTYIEAIKKIKVVPKEQVNNAAELLFQMANSLSSVGYQKYIIEHQQAEHQEVFNQIHSCYGDINTSMDDVRKNISGLNKEFDSIREKTMASVKIVEKTDSIIKYIQNVATQMTLLGFNASIEAKRVGAVGAGFNVIAQEVRKLAEQTSNQTQNVEDVLTQVRSSINNIDGELVNAYENLQENIERINQLNELINNTSGLIEKIDD